MTTDTRTPRQPRGVPGGRPPRTQQPLRRLPGNKAGGRAAGSQRSPASVTAAASPISRGVPRVPFALLVLGLLGGSLVCLLVINTTLGAASFRISQLQQKAARLSTQEQILRQQVAAEQAPAAIAERAYALGMRTQNSTTILDLRSDQIDRLSGQAGMGVQLGAPPPAPTPSASAAASKPAAAQTPTPGTTPAATPTAATPSPSASSPAPARSSP